MLTKLLRTEVAEEDDLVVLRSRTRELARSVGFENQDQTRLATAVSEVSRVMFRQGGRIEVEYGLKDAGGQRTLAVSLTSATPFALDASLNVVRRLVDGFELETSGAVGTTVKLTRSVTRRAPVSPGATLQKMVDEVVTVRSKSPVQELEEQNRELLRALEELASRQQELTELNLELADTNRGVVALYGELDDKAEQLRRANDLKSTFLFHMSHEFRTPLNSIIALSQMMLDRLDGPLTSEQERQVVFIERGARELTEMVNDLLDMAKVESGRVELHPSEWTVSQLFGALRGTLRPLVFQQPVQLTFEYAADVKLYTDEGKVSQILRNFISNAIKFTEQGEIRVSASAVEGGMVRFSVCDTGIGIANQDQARVFEQFTQVDNHRQRQVKGTGLGLPLTKKLARLLGGDVSVESELGRGSTFTVSIPQVLRSNDEAGETQESGLVGPSPAGPPEGTEGRRVLVIDDDDVARYLVRKQLSESKVEVLEARSFEDGRLVMRDARPDLVVLDLAMPETSGFDALEEMRNEPSSRAIPVVIHTSLTLGERDQELLSRHAAAIVRKGTNALRSTVEVLLQSSGAQIAKT